MYAGSLVSAPSLRRTLKLSQLVIMGVILVQPTAPMPLFGVVFQEARGHVVVAILLAMVAMLLTAVSYGRMARAYPSAGSAYTYVGEEIHPVAGYLTGWSMLLDYVLNPLICTIWCAKAAGNIAPAIPYALWALFFAGLFTFLNLRQVQTTAQVNTALAVVMGLVIVWFLWAVGKYIAGLPSGVDAAFFLKPFYDPATFSMSHVATGTSLAVLTYIGFDAISTLSEEVVDPKRNILRATVLVCLITGVLSAIEVYAAQLIWPFGQVFPDIDTAFVHVAGKAGGVVLFQALNLTLLVASIGSGAGGQLAGARMLYGMGRDGSIPRGMFGHVDSKSGIPTYNVLLIGALSALGAFLMSYELGAELLNFGAFIGFMGVNIAAILRWYVRAQDKKMSALLPPVFGFLICFVMWLNLRTPAKLSGFGWLALGAALLWWRGKVRQAA